MTSAASLSCSRMFLKLSGVPAGTAHCIPSPLLCGDHLKDPRQCSLPAVFFPHLLASLISFPFHLLTTVFPRGNRGSDEGCFVLAPNPFRQEGQGWDSNVGVQTRDRSVSPGPASSVPQAPIHPTVPSSGKPSSRGFSASQNEVLEEFSDDLVVRIPGSHGLGSIPGLGTGIPYAWRHDQ